jgi:hypothetical protein
LNLKTGLHGARVPKRLSREQGLFDENESSDRWKKNGAGFQNLKPKLDIDLPSINTERGEAYRVRVRVRLRLWSLSRRGSGEAGLRCRPDPGPHRHPPPLVVVVANNADELRPLTDRQSSVNPADPVCNRSCSYSLCPLTRRWRCVSSLLLDLFFCWKKYTSCRSVLVFFLDLWDPVS